MDQVDAILSENAGILASFKANGVPMNRNTEFVFICEFKTKDEARAFRTVVRLHFAQEGLPNGIAEVLYGVCDYSKQRGPSEMHMCITMQPDADVITQIEVSLRKLSEHTGCLGIAWEFADPRNRAVGE